MAGLTDSESRFDKLTSEMDRQTDTVDRIAMA